MLRFRAVGAPNYTKWGGGNVDHFREDFEIFSSTSFYEKWTTMILDPNTVTRKPVDDWCVGGEVLMIVS